VGLARVSACGAMLKLEQELKETSVIVEEKKKTADAQA